jgi:hypothetical protein
MAAGCNVIVNGMSWYGYRRTVKTDKKKSEEVRGQSLSTCRELWHKINIVGRIFVLTEISLKKVMWRHKKNSALRKDKLSFSIAPIAPILNRCNRL